MNKETLRMQMLSGVITESEYKAKLEESKKPLNENFVGIGAINNPFADREKTDYELAFEHFTKGTSLNENEEELEEAHPLEGGPGYMTKHHAGVLMRLISDYTKELEKAKEYEEDAKKENKPSLYSSEYFINGRKAIESLETALETAKINYEKETGGKKLILYTK